MKSLLAALLLLTAFSASAQEEKEALPFRSRENLDYVSKKNDPLIGLVKSDTFHGVVLRPEAGLETLRLVDHHLFPAPRVAALDEQICRQSVQRILTRGEGENAPVRIVKVELFPLRGGQTACEVEAADVKSDSMLKRYRAVIGLDRGAIRAFVAQDGSPIAREGESEELRAFLQGLR